MPAACYDGVLGWALMLSSVAACCSGAGVDASAHADAARHRECIAAIACGTTIATLVEQQSLDSHCTLYQYGCMSTLPQYKLHIAMPTSSSCRYGGGLWAINI